MSSSPVAICTDCGKYAISATQINYRCSEKPDGKNRCKGVFGSALSTDWAVCDACNGDGEYENAQCQCCQGYGVMYVRAR